MPYRHTAGDTTWHFADLRTLMAKATPARSGDVLAGIAAETAVERMAARMALADVPLRRFLDERAGALRGRRGHPPHHRHPRRRRLRAHRAPDGGRASATGCCRTRPTPRCPGAALAPGVTPEMAAAVSKLMRNQDLILAARKCHVVTRFRNTIGLPGRLSVRLQPNHPTDDPRGIAGVDARRPDATARGDAVIGINPATDSVPALIDLLAPARRGHRALRASPPSPACSPT